jgi:AcrR family transcriptional regulator
VRRVVETAEQAVVMAPRAEESGWSIGSIRYYFPNKDELIASALWRVGERVDQDADDEAERLRVLLDGLRLQLITTPGGPRPSGR